MASGLSTKTAKFPEAPRPIARLIAATKSFIVLNPEDDYTAPETIGEIMAYVARISNPGNQHNNKTAPSLLAYCLENKHWSVFETCSLTIEVQTSRAIAQQILRHRSYCFQEYSLRYAAATTYEKYEARRQDSKNRQDSIDDLPASDKAWFEEAQEKVWELSFGLYTEAIRRGVALECARFLLPLSTTTTLCLTGNVRSWIHYFLARCVKGVQKEHRDIAWAMLPIFLNQVPELRIYMAEKLGCSKLMEGSDGLITPHSWKWLVEQIGSGEYTLYFAEFPESEPFRVVKWGFGNPGVSELQNRVICIEPWDGVKVPQYLDSGCYAKPDTRHFKLKPR